MAAQSAPGAGKKQKLTPINVFLRVRPQNEIEGQKAITHCTPKEIQIRGHAKTYTFDQIFDANTTQTRVYQTVASRMIKDVLKGYNCTVFAYGQTGTGKTYTILGDGKDVDETSDWRQECTDGLIVRASKHLFQELGNNSEDIQRTVTVSFMEIYNEEIRDLLAGKDAQPLRIYEDKVKSVHVRNLQEVTVLNVSEIFNLLRQGCDKRQVAATLLNHRSSRSHTVFTITVSTIETISAGNLSNIVCGKLNLIDLAGSENVAKSGSKEQRAREATNINLSLLTLGRVIKALSENSSHVPYRESKLTRILQDSLGGRAKTSIIATISPAANCLDETLNTLEYAYSARNVTNCPTINLRTSEYSAALQEELAKLKRDLFATANQQGIYLDKENYEEMTQSLAQYKKDALQKHQELNTVMEQLEDMLSQKQEWENLKKSFELTQKAYQECQSEIQLNQGIIQEDKAVIGNYKKEYTELQEFVDSLIQREKLLFEKFDKISSSSNNNEAIMERYTRFTKQTFDDIGKEKSNTVANISATISHLSEINMDVCNNLSGLKARLGSDNSISEANLSIVQSNEQNVPNIFDNICSKLIICDKKQNDIDSQLEQSKKMLNTGKIEAVLQNAVSKIVDKYKAFSQQVNQEEFQAVLCEQKMHEDRNHAIEMQRQIAEYEVEINSVRIRQATNLDIRKKCRREREQILKMWVEEDAQIENEMDELKMEEEELEIQKQFLQKANKERRDSDTNIINFIERFKRLQELIKDSTALKEEIENVKDNVLPQLEQIHCDVTNKLESIQNLNSSELRGCIQQVKEEMYNGLALVGHEIDQVSNKINSEGAQLVEIQEMLHSYDERISSIIQSTTVHIDTVFKKSIIKVVPTGATPNKVEHIPARPLRSRNSLVRTLLREEASNEEKE